MAYSTFVRFGHHFYMLGKEKMESDNNNVATTDDDGDDDGGDDCDGNQGT